MAQCCLHHESIQHRVDSLEKRVDRIELGIFSTLAALLLSIIGLFIQIWDLPRVIQQDIKLSEYRVGK